jgi:hypothetical protein
MTIIETAAIREERGKQGQTSSPRVTATKPGQSLSRHIPASHRAPLFFIRACSRPFVDKRPLES